MVLRQRAALIREHVPLAKPAGVAEMREFLPSRHYLLVYFLTKFRSFLFVVSRDHAVRVSELRWRSKEILMPNSAWEPCMPVVKECRRIMFRPTNGSTYPLPAPKEICVNLQLKVVI